jgi:hypothetical protein
MISVTGSQRELLLDPIGNSVWSGLQVQSLNSNAITWSLAKEMYGPSGPYFIIPLGIFVGFAAIFVHWLISKVNEQTTTRIVQQSVLTWFFTVALALHRPRQGRQCYTSYHYSVCRFCSKSPSTNTVHQPLMYIGLTQDHPITLNCCLDHSRGSGIAALAAPVPSRMVPQIQLYLGRRA